MDEQLVSVGPEDAADWLIRSALPRFLSLMTLTGHAHHFAQLPPYEGHTSTGKVRGWQGAGSRIKTVERHLSDLQHGLERTGIRYEPVEPSDTERETRDACEYAQGVLLPSRLGWDAYRVIGASSRLARHAAQVAGDPAGAELVESAWRDSWLALTDRAQVRTLLETAS